MTKVYTDPTNYTNIAAAIREKNGNQTTYKPNQMAAAIRAIEPSVQALTVTENGTYTAPEGVDGYTPITVNVQSGSAGFIAAIFAHYTQGTTCTCTKGATVYTSDTSGHYSFGLPEAGTWTLAANGGSFDIAVAQYSSYNVQLTVEILKSLCLQTAYVRLSNAVGDKYDCNSKYGHRYMTRTSNEPVLVFRWCGASDGSGYGGYVVLSKSDTLPCTYTEWGDPVSYGTYTVDGVTLYIHRQNGLCYPSDIYSLDITTDQASVNIKSVDTWMYMSNNEFKFSGAHADELQNIIKYYAHLS